MQLSKKLQVTEMKIIDNIPTSRIKTDNIMIIIVYKKTIHQFFTTFIKANVLEWNNNVPRQEDIASVASDRL